MKTKFISKSYIYIYRMFSEVKQKQNIAKCSENLKSKNPKISHETVTSLCETLNGILGSPNKRDIPEKLDSLLHQWFNDNSLIEEIYKTINSKDLCFLHPVFFNFGLEMFYVAKHRGRGRDLESNAPIDFKKYYNDQIKGCDSNLMAFEFGYYWPGDPFGHSTMVVIERGETRSDGKQLIEVEHFDSSNIEVEQIKVSLENFIKSLFGEENFYFKFHHQDEVCDFNIQGSYFNITDKFSGSCTQFALWYGFKRLLEPYKTRKEVIAEIEELLYINKNDPDSVMIILIKQFQSLLTIKTAENNNLKMQANGRDLRFLSKKNATLRREEVIEEYEEKLKKYEDALDDLLKSNSETDWQNVDNLQNNVNNMLNIIMENYGAVGERLERKKIQLNRKKEEADYIRLFHNGFKPFRETLEKYEDAFNQCKSSRSDDACALADSLQVESESLADIAKTRYMKGQPRLIENKTIADLVAKHEQLFREHAEIKKSKRPTGSSVASLISKYENMGKKKGGINTKRKKRRDRKQKSMKSRARK